jgi:hypothetical protein
MELFCGLRYFDIKKSFLYITFPYYIVYISIVLWLSYLYNVMWNGQQITLIL